MQNSMMHDEIITKLKKLARGNDDYREFNARIVNDLAGAEFIGVRTPDLRKIAKKIAKGNWRAFLVNNDWQIYELKQIAFLLPSYLKLDFDESFALYDELIPHATSWANCDTLGEKKRFIRDNPDKSWAKIAQYLDSNNGWEVRIGLNLVFANFLNDENIERTFAEILKIDARYRKKVAKGTLDYYVKMMLAWTLAEAAIKYRERIEQVLSEIDKQTAKYTQQKMRDSYRIPKRQPQLLELVSDNNSTLRKKCRRLMKTEILSTEIQNLIDDIKFTSSKRKTSIGLSANQVGESVAISVIAIKPTPARPHLKVFEKVCINTEIIETFGEKELMWEGCQSITDDNNDSPFAKTPRYAKIRVKYLDRCANEHDEILEGFVVHVIQHETDHLNGILFTDLVDERNLITGEEYRRKILQK